MTQDQSIRWGPIQLKYRPTNLAKEDVKTAADLVPLSSTNLPDTFVALGLGKRQVFAVVPTKPIAKRFTVATQDIDIPEALKRVLEEAAKFLKGPI